MFVSTSIAADHPWAMGCWSLAVIVQTVLRVRLARVAQPGNPEWRGQTEAILLAGGAIWGLMAGWAVRTYGFSSPTTLSLLIYHAAIAVVSGPIFIHSIARMRLFLALLFIPALLISAMGPALQPWRTVCAFFLYGAFLSVRGQWLSEEYLRELAEYARLATTAHVDSLTGLPNRQSIREVLAREVARAEECGAGLGLIFLDLDGFKAVNDRYSHRIGDLLLCEVAHRLGGCLGNGEYAGRLGGDEFLVVLTGEPRAEMRRALREKAVQIVSLLTQRTEIEGVACGVGVSMGLALFPDVAADAEHLVRAADHAMYEAKRAGTNQIREARAREELERLAVAVGRAEVRAAVRTSAEKSTGSKTDRIRA